MQTIRYAVRKHETDLFVSYDGGEILVGFEHAKLFILGDDAVKWVTYRTNRWPDERYDIVDIICTVRT